MTTRKQERWRNTAPPAALIVVREPGLPPEREIALALPKPSDPAPEKDRLAYSASRGCVTLAVRILPKASRNAIAGVAEIAGRFALSIRIAAAPKDGEANAALIMFLSKELGIRKADVTIASGKASRLKLLKIQGDDQQIVKRLQSILGQE